jgi:phospholipid/cholesterol/gamma-HCH transport system substrate-binding protein
MKRRDEVLVGLFLTLGIIVLVLGSIWLARGGLSSGYPLHARFEWGQNLKQGQPVLLAGINVGYIDDVELMEEGYLTTTFRIEDGRKIPRSSKATVVSIGIFGDVAIGLTPDTMPTAGGWAAFQPGDTVPTGEAKPSIDQLMTRADSIAESVQVMTLAMQRDFVAAGGFRDLRQTIANTQALTAQLTAVAVEQNRNITRLLASVERSASAVDSAKIGATLENFRASSENVASLTTELRTTTARLNGVMASLENGNGTVGKLLTDTLLYSDLRRLTTRLDSLTLDFKQNPRKYINLEIF